MTNSTDDPTLPPGGEVDAGTGGPAFPVDALIAGRYRIVEFIARGGMGEVYEALDLELRQSVALKIVRPQLAMDRRSMERFRREISLARRVTHPNVCRIFDFGRHRIPGGGDFTFLTMELLRGRTLEDRLRDGGRMTADDALPVARQMAEALAAAHEAGVVHRDFKSANVVLVPSRDGLRAVVTDFGLAQGHMGEEWLSLSVTGTDLVVGTVAYMAPEQAEGLEATPRSDIYSFGVVLFEMMTAALPHAGTTPMAMLVNRLKAPPRSPRAVNPDIEPRWEAAILKCLALRPEDRFAEAREVIGVLTGATELPPVPPPASSPSVEVVSPVSPPARLRRLATWGAALVAALALAAVFFVGRPGSPPGAGATRVRRSIAILGFKNLSGRPDASWLSTALSEMLMGELAAGERLRTISGEDVARMKRELSLAEADSLAKDTLARIRGNLGADLVVLGSFLAQPKDAGGQLRLILTLQDARKGETVATLTESGTEAGLLPLVSHLGARLRERLGETGISEAEAGAARAFFPSSPEALRLYSEGVAKLRLLDASAASDLLEKAVAADPRHPLSHSALADSWSALGYDARAREEAGKAFDLSKDLSREERFFVEGRFREMSREWERAIEIYRTLYGFFPDNVDYGLKLAEAQTAAGRFPDAVRTITMLRKMPPPASEDVRIDLAESDAANARSAYQEGLAAAQRAARKGRDRGAGLLVARAELSMGNAYVRLGQTRKGAEACQRARQIFAGAGDRSGEARAMNRIADVYFEEGDLPRARALFEEELALCRAIGNRFWIAIALNNVADTIKELGSLEEARRLEEEAIQVTRETGNRVREGIFTSNLGDIYYLTGDLPKAKITYDAALSINRETGYKYALRLNLLGLGGLFLTRGEPETARPYLEECVEGSREAGDRRLLAYSLSSFGELLRLSGDTAGARARVEESLALRRDLGEQREMADSRLALARLSLDEGRLEAAGKQAEEAAEQFRAQQIPERAAVALGLVGESLAERRKGIEAARTVAEAALLVHGSQNPHVRAAVTLSKARVAVAAGKIVDARSLLSDSISETSRLGLVTLRLEAGLTLGAIELRNGEAAIGGPRLQALEKDAQRRGLASIVRRAAAARTPR